MNVAAQKLSNSKSKKGESGEVIPPSITPMLGSEKAVFLAVLTYNGEGPPCCGQSKMKG